MTMYTANVRRFIRAFYATRAQSCFEHASRNDQNVRGTVTISFTIGATGQVSETDVQRNTTENEALGRCLATQVRGWRLPQPPRGEPIALAMPFSR
jgi:TonB family protein